jgi:hypothetical protein
VTFRADIFEQKQKQKILSGIASAEKW